MMYHYLYKTTNIITKQFYIGKHSSNKSNDRYLGSGKLLLENVKEYGREYFIKEILSMFNSEQECLDAERKIVTKELISDKLCLNMVVGGKGTWVFAHQTEKFNTTGKISVFDKNGHHLFVTNDEFDSSLHVPVATGVNIGKVPVYDPQDINRKYFLVNRDDPRYLSGQLVHNSKGKATVRDQTGKCFTVWVDDPRYLSGELVPVAKKVLRKN